MRGAKSYFRSQEKFAEALNCMGKCQDPQSDRKLVCQLCRRVDRLEHELTETKKQLNGIVCSHAGGEDSVPRSQCPSFRFPRRDGSRRKIAYMLLEEGLIRITDSQHSYGEPFHSSLWQRALDEL